MKRIAMNIIRRIAISRAQSALHMLDDRTLADIGVGHRRNIRAWVYANFQE